MDKMGKGSAFKDNVQVLRGIAALMVVAVHSIDIAHHQPESTFRVIGSLENFGAAGVDLFFVISGFVIAHTAFAGSRRWPMDFARERLWRVVPLYLLFSLPYAFMSTEITFGTVVATVLFWPAADPYVLSTPLMLIGWTLCFEMLFYTAATIALLRRGRAVLVLLLLAYAACWMLGQATNLAAFRFLGNPLILEFLFGVLIAQIASRTSSQLGPLSIIAGVGWFAAVIVLGFEGPGFDDPAVWKRVLVWGLPSALIVLGAIVMEPWRPAAISGPLLLVGAASYSIYLAHPLALWLLQGQLRLFHQHWHGMVFLAAGLAASLLGGLLVYRCIEQPILAFRRSAWPRSTQIVLQVSGPNAEA
jgi:exopolysaccharide production protein ExoZ